MFAPSYAVIYVLPISVYYVPTLQYKNWDEQLEWGEIRLKLSSILLDSHFRTPHQLNGANIPFSDQKAHIGFTPISEK